MTVRSRAFPHRTRRFAILAAGAAVLLTTGAGTAGATASVPRQPTKATAAASPQLARDCPSGALCVHGFDEKNGQSGPYYWKDLYYCGEFGLGDFVPTYYVNNQTKGTVGQFRDKNHALKQKTGPAPSQGKVNDGYHVWYAQPC
ncbi:hypothetical protein [Streptomyces varsoviensis]|uniref:Peptidase inhibitor family I36 n=1 Tax=Streptomyces varsoviensis TaxID=67373 RepID=A0ABR5J5I9_9ACTN|nr:hypothetical protein [Streptomyces varsoviensis]KOG88727.1 hypothetical protein ADK38_18190 [Streptomyces varsoviensis]